MTTATVILFVVALALFTGATVLTLAAVRAVKQAAFTVTLVDESLSNTRIKAASLQRDALLIAQAAPIAERLVTLTEALSKGLQQAVEDVDWIIETASEFFEEEDTPEAASTDSGEGLPVSRREQ